MGQRPILSGILSALGLSVALLPGSSTGLAQEITPPPPRVSTAVVPGDVIIPSSPPVQGAIVPCEECTKDCEWTTEEGPEYGGPFLTREKLSGDWLGLRTDLAEHGMTFDLSATQFYQGVMEGGRVRDWEYGGKLDYYANLDSSKMGLWEGMLVNMHAETRYGTSVNEIDGLLAPSNIAMQFPRPNENITSITGLKITQALSENFAVYAGKINTLDEYALQYAGGPGLGGFMNTSLVFNPILARTVPYSAAGVGGAVLVEGAPIFSFTVFDPEERATKGLDDLYARGAVLAPELVLRVKPFGRPGTYDLGGTYSTARYRSTAPEAYLQVPNLGIVGGQETGSWSLYSNFYQAVWVDPHDEERTWGVFGQLGLSDGNPNPIRYAISMGVGGRSPLPCRKLDRFGVGYFYLGLSDSFKRLAQAVLPQRDEYGVEMFYNYAVTPWCRLTADFQVARPSTQIYDTVLIGGLRLQLIF